MSLLAQSRSALAFAGARRTRTGSRRGPSLSLMIIVGPLRAQIQPQRSAKVPCWSLMRPA
jgi:hypothetical protein